MSDINSKETIGLKIERMLRSKRFIYTAVFIIKSLIALIVSLAISFLINQIISPSIQEYLLCSIGGYVTIKFFEILDKL
jgi:hypothetical protein